MSANTPPVAASKSRTRAESSTDLPVDLETAQSKLCYFAISQTSGATLDDLAETLDLGKLTLLEVLGTLTERGHVQRHDGRYSTC